MCSLGFAKLTPEEAVAGIPHGAVVAVGGFTTVGSVKKIPVSLANRAEQLHKAGKPFRIKLYSGASTGDAIDGALSRAEAIQYRAPYQSNLDLRNAINAGKVQYCDVHLSHFPQWINYRFLEEIDYALVEVADYTTDGELTLTFAVGTTPTFCQHAKHIILEHNAYPTRGIQGLHDIYTLANPPHRQPIPLTHVSQRMGTATLKVDPKKILGVVETDEADKVSDFKAIGHIHERIGQHVAEFFIQEIKQGRLPKSFLPIQSGVGNIANAVLKVMGGEHAIPPFQVYTEVAQDAVLELMAQERVTFTSTCALTVTPSWQEMLRNHLSTYKQRLVLRPQEISNHPEIIRRLGLIAMNAALEVDCFGNVNSTHVMGASVMNGIGGSGDFARNGYLSIFTLPSTAKNGTISSIIPFCSHIDHTEHDVQIIVTEQGLADLRGKSPEQRAVCIIENCAHPDYKPLLRDYLKRAKSSHIGQDLDCAFKMYTCYAQTGDMRHCSF